MWKISDRAWLYIVQDRDHAGNGIAALSVADIEHARAGLEARHVATGPIEQIGDAGRKAVVLDPDGNAIALLEVKRAT